MPNTQKQIINRLRNLKAIDGVKVKVSSGGGTVSIRYPTKLSLDFKFVWQDEHFIGYFMDKEGSQSQAVISLWEPMDAIHFVTAYSLLIELRAHRPKP